jgi:hypothetical protein
MPRKLKTFVTESGFFELAVAAPSMKAALKDWDIDVNLFQQGLARQTEDPAIIKAAEAAPGRVLRRPIGSKQPFREGAELPQVKGSSRGAKSAGQAKRASAARKKAGAVDLHAIREARAALEEAKTQHRKRVASLDKERDALERRVEWEEEDWRREKKRLEDVIDRLKR